MKLSLRSKLFFFYGFTVVPFFLISGFGYLSMQKLNIKSDIIARQVHEVSAINELVIDISLSLIPLHSFIAYGNPNEIESFSQMKQQITKSFIIADKILPNLSSKIQLLRYAKELFNQYTAIANNILYSKIQSNEKNEEKLNSIFEDLITVIGSFQRIIKENAKKERDETIIKEQIVFKGLMLSWLITFVITIVLILVTTKYALRAVSAIAKVAKDIGEGNLSSRTHFNSDDEIGDLMKMINLMTDKLQKTTVSKTYLNNILQSMNEALLVINLKGNILQVNHKAVEVFGFSEKEFEIMNARNFFSKQFFLTNLEKVSSNTKLRINKHQTFCITSRGHKIPVDLSMAPLEIVNKQSSRLVIVLHDIREKLATEKRLNDLSDQLITVREEEQANIATNIHDNIAGSLAALKIWFFSMFEKTMLDNNLDENRDYKQFMTTLDEVIQSSRNISHLLSPDSLKGLGIIGALNDLVTKISSANLHILLDIEDLQNYFKENWDVNLYRIVQESLINIQKHANATKVKIIAKINDREIILKIIDNGKGFKIGVQVGMGLSIVQRRAALLGGNLKIYSKKNIGTIIHVKFSKR